MLKWFLFEPKPIFVHTVALWRRENIVKNCLAVFMVAELYIQKMQNSLELFSLEHEPLH